MAKYLKKKKKKPVALILILVLVLLILLAAFAIFIMPQLLYRLSGGGEENLSVQTEPQSMNMAPTDAVETTEPPIPTVQFPLLVDDGRLEINSLFQFTGLNPDCGNQEGTDIASVVLKNLSGVYLAEAKITLTLLDGAQLNFVVTELPAGASAMAFSTENLSIPTDAACVSVACEASFDPSAVTVSDQVTAEINGTAITLTNVSGQDLSQIVVYCRSPLGEEYFGGNTYSYTVTDLPAGESTVVDAADCILGMAEVVRFVVN